MGARAVGGLSRLCTCVTQVAFGADAPKLDGVVAATVNATFFITSEHEQVDAGRAVQARPGVTGVIRSGL